MHPQKKRASNFNRQCVFDFELKHIQQTLFFKVLEIERYFSGEPWATCHHILKSDTQVLFSAKRSCCSFCAGFCCEYANFCFFPSPASLNSAFQKNQWSHHFSTLDSSSMWFSCCHLHQPALLPLFLKYYLFQGLISFFVKREQERSTV